MQGLTNPFEISIAVAIFISTLYIGNEIGLRIKINSPGATIGAIIGTVLLISLLEVWRSFAGPFVIPVLSQQAKLAVLGMHFSTGLLFGLANAKRVRDQILKNVRTFMAENPNAFNGEQAETALLQVIENTR